MRSQRQSENAQMHNKHLTGLKIFEAYTPLAECKDIFEFKGKLQNPNSIEAELANPST